MVTRNKSSSVVIATVLTILTLYLYSCSAGRYLKTESAAEQEITGHYTLILYGGSSVNDLKTLAILVKEGTPYTFEIYAPEFDYRTTKGVPATKALELAEKFVSFHHNFWKAQLSRILDNKGSVIGYELRPLYYPTIHSQSDILDVNYRQSNDKVVVYINFYEYPPTERFPFEGGRGFGPK